MTNLDLLTAARALGAVWLGAGMVTMHLALRRFGIGAWLSGSIAAVAGVWWPSLSSATVVTNYAPLLLIKALGLLVLAGAWRGQAGGFRILALVAVAAFAAGV